MTITGYPIPLDAITQWRGVTVVLRMKTVDGTPVALDRDCVGV